MANPEHKEVLDDLDKLSVCLYRVGISLFAVFCFLFSIMISGLGADLASFKHVILMGMCLSTAFSAANIHVYSKKVRVVISYSAWIGILLMFSDSEQVRTWLSLGFIFVVFSGIALKESFCFKVVGLKLVPLLLAIATLSLAMGFSLTASILMAISAVIIAYLSVVKWRMPLHFDIGNKANYEI